MAIANRASWQIGGRRGTAETAAQYAAKYDAYLTTVRAAAPTKPILCITPILNRADLKTGGNQNGERPDFYRDRIASVVRRRQQSDLNLYFLDGLTLIDDPLFLLVTDNVHPNDAGMHWIAQGVAAALNRFSPQSDDSLDRGMIAEVRQAEQSPSTRKIQTMPS